MTELPYSEADTRRQLIDQRLRLAGWNLDDPTQVIQELDIHLGAPRAVAETGTSLAGHQFADYGLVLRGRSAAVVEAKKTSRDAEVGQEQAKQYADRLQQLNGGSRPTSSNAAPRSSRGIATRWTRYGTASSGRCQSPPTGESRAPRPRRVAVHAAPPAGYPRCLPAEGNRDATGLHWRPCSPRPRRQHDSRPPFHSRCLARR